MDISVIICTYNRSKLLHGALISLDNQVFSGNFEIIVVDDGSTDDTEKVCKNISLKNTFHYFKTPHKSRASARNFGISKSSGKYLLFVDDDILAVEDLLEKHFKILSLNKKNVVRGPVIDVCEYSIPRCNPKINNYSMAFFCTCNASVSSECLKEIGCFDEDFTEYGWEDTELGLRFRQAGFKMRFLLNAPIYHYKPIGKDFLKTEIAKARELARMAIKFINKHSSWRAYLATGITPFHLFVNSYFYNEKKCNDALKKINEGNFKNNSAEYYNLVKKVYNYYYNKELKQLLWK